MRILIHGINFSPELTGIGKYTGEMAEWLSAQGHEVRVVTAPPYYPQWKVADGYVNGWRKELLCRSGFISTCRDSSRPTESIVNVYRCPLWVPASPSGLKRILHLASFAISSFPFMLRQIFWRPDVVWVVEPALFCAPSAWITARLSGAKAWLHVQDFEVDAAFEMGLLRAPWARNFSLWCERLLMGRFDRVSTISRKMYQKLLEKGVESDRAILFQNWADTHSIFPMSFSQYRNELKIPSGVVVALYSGNMGEKQGLEIVIEAARSLAQDENILFVMCGDGAAKNRLKSLASDLSNITWLPLQPLARLNDLLNLADFHLLPQRADVADLVMPSKLTGMLASGRPIVVTAREGSELADSVAGCGLVIQPENSTEFANAIKVLAYSSEMRAKLGRSGREFAEMNLDKSSVLKRFESALFDLV